MLQLVISVFMFFFVSLTGCAQDTTGVSKNQFRPDEPQDILFISNSDGDHEIYLVEKLGSKPIQLTHNSRDDSGASWSPDGTEIVYTSMQNGNADIYVMRKDGSNQKALTIHEGLDAHPQWSPDGSQVVFVSNRNGVEDIYLITLKNGTLTRLSDSSSGAFNPQFSPDGRFIVYQQRVVGTKGVNLVLVDMVKETTAKLTDGKKRIDIHVEWAPDSQSLIIASKQKKPIDLFHISIDGSMVKQLTDSIATDADPKFSPDGEKILFLSQQADGVRQELYTINVDGTGMRKVLDTTGLEYSNPNWSPDGSLIAFSRFENGHFVAYICSADGSNLRKISEVSGFQFQPVVAPSKNS